MRRVCRTRSPSFSSEFDRVYLSAPDSSLIEAEGQRPIKLEKNGFPDAVVWNPWIEKAQKMADFDDEEYKTMLCIEPAVAGSGPVCIQPGSSWKASQIISVV